MQNLNVGLIGGGFMGKAHSLAYAAMPMFYWPAPALPVRSILAESSDALATVLPVLGPRAGLDFAEQHGVAALLCERTAQGPAMAMTTAFAALAP